MPDREKVIKGLECCRNRHLCMCRECPYFESNTNPDDEDDDTCTFDLNDDALALLKEQEAVRWIPVTERLPKSMANKVIVYLQHEDLVPEIGYGHYEKYKGVEMWYNLETNEQFSKRGYTVTHWMPMPKSPEGEKLVLY